MNASTIGTDRSNLDHNKAIDWVRKNPRKTGGIALAILALLLLIWLAFAPSKITPFTIEDGRGINAYVTDFDKSIDIAEQNSIPVTYGPGWDGEPLSYDAARALGDTLDRDQVTVHVRTGDRFDEDGNYTPASTGRPFAGS